MARERSSPGQSGFTAVEAILVVAIVGIVSVMLFPALGEMIRVAKMTGVTQEGAALLRRCRFESIKRGVPCRVAIDVTRREMLAFADVHGPLLTDPPDGVFKQIVGQPAGVSDYEVGRKLLPGGIEFAFLDASGLDSVEGFTGSAKEAVFRPNGSIEDTGAFRFQDPRGNSLEVRVATTAAARIEVLKHDGTAWRSQGELNRPWKWK